MLAYIISVPVEEYDPKRHFETIFGDNWFRDGKTNRHEVYGSEELDILKAYLDRKLNSSYSAPLVEDDGDEARAKVLIVLNSYERVELEHYLDNNRCSYTIVPRSSDIRKERGL